MIRLRQREGAGRCAYCHASDGALLACLGCATTMHPECASALVNCPTPGCANKADPSLAYATQRAKFEPTAGLPGGTVARDRLRWALRAKERKHRNAKRWALVGMVGCALLLIAIEFLSAAAWSL